MLAQVTLYALAAAAFANAHGRLDQQWGDSGGNGTALGVLGAVVPGGGPNYMTEVDTTVFWSHTFATDDDSGFTESSNGNLSPEKDLSAAMDLAGTTLPQVTAGGFVKGNWHTVTDDGCGPLQAAIDPTANNAWSTATDADVSTSMPGFAGFCTQLDSGDDEQPAPEDESFSSNSRRLARRALAKMGLTKRANNVNKSFEYTVSIPSDISCTGTVNGISNLCQVKVSNNNVNGPFGGTFLVQQASGSSNSSSGSGSASAPAASTTSTATSSSGSESGSSSGSSSNSDDNFGSEFGSSDGSKFGSGEGFKSKLVRSVKFRA